MKPIRLTAHAKGYQMIRGFSAEEVFKTIRRGTWKIAEWGRWECQLDIDFNDEWNGELYRSKRIRPIFVEEEEEIVVITVYVYYY